MKQKFLLNEYWSLSISGAFQRANVYKSETTRDKDAFKTALKSLIVQIAENYQTAVTEEQHIEHIKEIENFKHEVLTNEHLNFGVSQKLLNLYLKYLWCADIIKIPPPHFPVDRLIQQELFGKIHYNWTEIEDENRYKFIIEEAKKVQGDISSLAELELKNFRRRNS